MADAFDTAWSILKGDCVGKQNNCSCKECVNKMCGPNCDCKKCAMKKQVMTLNQADGAPMCDIQSMGLCDCTPETGCKLSKLKYMKKSEKDSRLASAGVSGYNKPKRTPNHPKKSHVVVARSGGQVKTIRFGQQGKQGAGANPKTPKEKARQKSFKARHAKNIKRGPMSAAYWADKVKW